MLRFGCATAPRTKGRKVASKKHAEAPLQRTGRQKGNKQAPGCGGARELRQASVGREGGVRFPRGKMIKGKFSVGEEAVPFRQGEVDVDGGKDGDKMVFERANVPFGYIRTVVV